MDNSSKPLTYSEYQKLVRKSVIDSRLGKGLIRDVGISLGVGLFNGLIVYNFTKGVSDILSPLVLIVTTFFIYGIIYLIYFKIERVNIYNEQKEIIDDLLPANPQFVISPEPFSPIKGVQMLNIINCSESKVSCRASLAYVAPMIFDKFQAYPTSWYSKKLVWGTQKCPDGNIVIDRNHGRAVIDFAKVFDNGYKLLFQDGDNIKEGFDGSPPEHLLGEGVHLIQLRLDGEINKKEFTVKEEYFILFKIEKIDERDGKDIFLPSFQFQKAFENSGGV